MSGRVSLAEHFKRLFDFSGHEDRASFWPYAAVAFLIIMVAGMIIFIPMMARAIEEMQQFAAQHPDQAVVSNRPSHYSITTKGDSPSFISTDSITIYLVVSFGLAVLLYAAAVTRRLRDRGKSGYWGIMPLPFIMYSTIQMPRLFAMIGSGGGLDMMLFLSVFLSNFLYIIALIWLIVMLAGPSQQLGVKLEGQDS